MRMKGASLFPLIALVSGLILGCAKEPSQPVENRAEVSTPAVAVPKGDGWVGRWNGPEGTYLEVVGSHGAYDITIKDLDAARIFKGVAAGDHIEFQRDGTTESLKATNGDDTGMKWLAGKSDCLTVKPGEGYCRD